MRPRGAPLDPRREIGDVRRIKADGGAEVDSAQLAPLDEALDGPRMDAKQLSGLVRREQRRERARLRQDTTRGDRYTRLSSLVTPATVFLSRVVLWR